MTNSPNRDQLTLDELRSYQAGRLTGTARHRVERLLLENPFYADALAGLEALQQTGASLPAQTAQLRSALHRRVHESATKQRLWPLWVTTAIAAIILVICITIYLIYFTRPAQTTKPTRALVPRSVSVVPSRSVRVVNRLVSNGIDNDAGDDFTHDLGGATRNGANPDIAVGAADGIVVDVAIATEKL